MGPTISNETSQTRHEPDRAKPSRYVDRWPDDGLPPRFDERTRSSVHPFAVLARTLTGR